MAEKRSAGKGVLFGLAMVGLFMQSIAAKRPTVLFLVGKDLCSQQANIAAQYPNYAVVCAYENTLTMARVHYWYFEKLFNVIYVVPAPIGGKNGEAFHDKKAGTKWAFSINWSVSIEHERLHLEEETFYTSDGMHGSPKTGAK